jgi:Sec-independent protein translocase protein TatA
MKTVMKKGMSIAIVALLLAGAASAQDATRKEGVKTTKIAQENAKQLQKEAKKSGSKSEQQAADKTMNAAKRAEKQAKKKIN